MNDQDVLERISAMVREEHELLGRSSDDGASDDEQARLNALQVGLDQCWDLLRQRRALRETGHNPNEAHVRDATTVEHYQQ